MLGYEFCDQLITGKYSFDLERDITNEDMDVTLLIIVLTLVYDIYFGLYKNYISMLAISTMNEYDLFKVKLALPNY